MNYTKLDAQGTDIYQVSGEYIGEKVVYWTEKDLDAREVELTDMVARYNAWVAELADIAAVKVSAQPAKATPKEISAMAIYDIQI